MQNSILFAKFLLATWHAFFDDDKYCVKLQLFTQVFRLRVSQNVSKLTKTLFWNLYSFFIFKALVRLHRFAVSHNLQNRRIFLQNFFEYNHGAPPYPDAS